MRILIDECLDWRLKRDLFGHSARAVSDVGWSGIKNGQLLSLAAGQFDVFLTADRNLSFQQNLTVRSLAVIVLQAESLRLIHTRPLMQKVLLLTEDGSIARNAAIYASAHVRALTSLSENNVFGASMGYSRH